LKALIHNYFFQTLNFYFHNTLIPLEKQILYQKKQTVEFKNAAIIFLIISAF